MKRKWNVQTMATLSLLLAIIIIMAFTPLGYIQTPWGIKITLIVVPVAIGTITMGPMAGTFLGLVFGLTSFVNSFSDPLGMMFLQVNPIGAFLCCVLPRMLVGFIPGWLYQKLQNTRLSANFVISLCCFLTPILNTFFYILFHWLIFHDTWVQLSMDLFQNQARGIHLLALMFGMVSVNGIVEAIACLLIGTMVCKALQKI